MKKHYSLLLAILVAFSSFFVSCNENDDDLASIICKITVKSDGGGTISITNYVGAFANVVIGNNVEVVATPAKGFVFFGWFVGDDETPVSTDAEYTFVVEENIALTAKFSKRPVVTVRSVGGGSVSIKDVYGTSKAFLPGSEVTVVATPNEDCDFIGWFDVGAETPVSTDAEYTFVVEENITLTAKFSKRLVVTVHSVGGGSVSIKDVYGTSKAFLPGSEVTVVATPNEDCDFIDWFDVGAEKLVSTDAEYTFAVMEDITLAARFERRKTYIDGYECIDLGLPSGIKWATCNVGATKPEEFGGYYAWGETEEKECYEWSTYKWCNGSYESITKYCTQSNYGTVDNKTVLDPEDDVAHVKWGGTWRMPTRAEQDELLNNCTWTWTNQNGVDGYTVTGPNGNSIFLPAAGDRYRAGVYNRYYCGSYWSSSLGNYASYCAYLLDFISVCYDRINADRSVGYSVRPVSE
ncbi:MAG: InlB B-repeat-containing protein [Bacteroidaceae bacterium]|nr:InlB B-repeat-containing protein [Bacteroidaceae bacterium]